MAISIEILKAKRGDAFVLLHGEGDNRSIVVVDGGWNGVYEAALRPALERLRARFTPLEELPIDLVVVSHVDEDHIAGVLDLTGELTQVVETGLGEPSFRIERLWHNTFEAVSGTPGAVDVIAPATRVAVAALAGAATLPAGVDRSNALVLASVAQGNRLLAEARTLGTSINSPLPSPIHVPDPTFPVQATLGAGISFHVLGPTLGQLTAFRDLWEEKTGQEAAPISLAAFDDDSITNLASIILLVTDEEGNSILLTGDARGDFICDAIDASGLTGQHTPLKLNVLKVPHHGSSNNVTQAFFERIVADHYLIAGDGSYGNPNVETFEMIIAARAADRDDYTIHLSHDPAHYVAYRGVPYDAARLHNSLARGGLGTRFDVRTPGAGDDSSLTLRLD